MTRLSYLDNDFAKVLLVRQVCICVLEVLQLEDMAVEDGLNAASLDCTANLLQLRSAGYLHPADTTRLEDCFEETGTRLTSSCRCSHKANSSDLSACGNCLERLL